MTVTLIGQDPGQVDLITLTEVGGVVNRTTPRPLTVVGGGREVLDVKGQPVEDAATVLEEAGFTVNLIGEEDGQASGLVIDQNPNPGESAECGSTVTLTYSTLN